MHAMHCLFHYKLPVSREGIVALPTAFNRVSKCSHPGERCSTGASLELLHRCVAGPTHCLPGLCVCALVTRFGKFCGILTLESFASTSLGLAVGSFAPSTDAALAIGPGVMVLFIVVRTLWRFATALPLQLGPLCDAGKLPFDSTRCTALLTALLYDWSVMSVQWLHILHAGCCIRLFDKICHFVACRSLGDTT